jgi:hypothetical protein
VHQPVAGSLSCSRTSPGIGRHIASTYCLGSATYSVERIQTCRLTTSQSTSDRHR